MVPAAQVPLIECDFDSISESSLIQQFDRLLNLLFRLFAASHAMQIICGLGTSLPQSIPIAVDGNEVEVLARIVQLGGVQFPVTVAAASIFKLLSTARIILADSRTSGPHSSTVFAPISPPR